LRTEQRELGQIVSDMVETLDSGSSEGFNGGQKIVGIWRSQWVAEMLLVLANTLKTHDT